MSSNRLSRVSSRRSAERVLLSIAADERAQQLMWRACGRELVGQGVRLEFCFSDGSAVALAARLRPDLIAIDLETPDVPGVIVLDSLRAHPELATVPIIVTSTRPRSLVEEPGAVRALPKPFDPDSFLAAVRETLWGKPQLRPAG